MLWFERLTLLSVLVLPVKETTSAGQTVRSSSSIDLSQNFVEWSLPSVEMRRVAARNFLTSNFSLFLPSYVFVFFHQLSETSGAFAVALSPILSFESREKDFSVFLHGEFKRRTPHIISSEFFEVEF